MLKESRYRALPGLPMLLVWLAILGVSIERFVHYVDSGRDLGILAAVIGFVVGTMGLTGTMVVNPNEGRVVTLFGRYLGSVRDAGLWWTNPFTVRASVSLRVRNFETAKLKVNDHHSNPIEIGAVVVWKVVDTAEALFEVDDFEHYVKIQAESALRALASEYPYDAHGPEAVALSTHTNEVSRALQTMIGERFHKAGVEVIEARIAHLAYAPEIAAAMLRRQQASAIIAARQKIVEGAVGMVENALQLLAERDVVELDAERKAQMVSNLLVVLCSDRDAQPVVNTGTIYS